jgi:hypothetical protein
MKKSTCPSCNSLITNNNFQRHKQICNGKPSLFVRHSNGLPVRKLRSLENIDWQVFQAYYDDNHSYMEACSHFNISSETASRAVQKGLFKTRPRTVTARLRGTHNRGPRTEEEKQKTREGMRRAVLEGRQKTPRPYGKKCKLFSVVNSLGETETLQGGWENLVAEYMSSNDIRWTRSKRSFTYVYETREHEYFPDFYLLDHDLYIEVKGMKTERDEAKWKQFPEKLLIIDKTNINDLPTFFFLLPCPQLFSKIFAL